MIRRLTEQVLAAALERADAAEVMAQRGETTTVQFENNRLKYVMTRANLGVGVRVIHEGRIGFSCTTDIADPTEVVRHAIDSAAFGQEAAFEFPGPADTGSPAVHDPSVPAFSVADAIAQCRGAIGRLLAYDDALDCAAGADMTESGTCLMNSAGLAREISTTAFDIGGYALRVEEDGSLLHTGEGAEWRALKPDMDEHVDKIIERLEQAKRVARLKPERMPVVFPPSALDLVMSSILANTGGKTHQKGVSRLIDKVGERVLGEGITILDDPLVDFAPGSAPFDGEGLPTQRRAIFQGGVFQGFCYDLQTAGLMKTAPTGSGFRGYSSQPGPGHANIRLRPGDVPAAQLLADVDRGLLVYDVLGGGQSNVLAGEFAVNVELGFLIEHGEVVGRAKDVMLAGNAFEAFNDVRALSMETEWHGAEEYPTVCLNNLSVVGSQT